MRIFADTNVLASAFGSRGLCADLLEIVIEQHELIVNELVLGGLQRILLRKFHLPAEDCRSVLSFLREFEIVATPDFQPAVSIPDKADAAIFSSALEGRCDLFVTGDRQLLAHVRRHRTIRALDPRQCWQELRQPRRGHAGR